jgi:hypothetical protein
MAIFVAECCLLDLPLISHDDDSGRKNQPDDERKGPAVTGILPVLPSGKIARVIPLIRA